MGDHRAYLKIEWSMHGHEAKQEFWYNYTPTVCCTCQVDRRILEWLTQQYEQSMDNWFEDQCSYDERQRAEEENRERDKLNELKLKYE